MGQKPLFKKNIIDYVCKMQNSNGLINTRVKTLWTKQNIQKMCLETQKHFVKFLATILVVLQMSEIVVFGTWFLMWTGAKSD